MGMGELNNLGLKHGTDKNSNYHSYLDVYESYLNQWKDKKISLIELGVGGYDYVDRGGESLRMWREYFRRGKIIGIDIYQKEGIIRDRIEFWQGSQTDKNLLKTILRREEEAEKRFVIDDASHNNKLTVETFNIIFPQLKEGDIYFIEDVHTSYYDDKEFEGSEKPGDKNTTMHFFSVLTHQLNGEHLKLEYQNQYARMIEFIHFYKEMIVIKRL